MTQIILSGFADEIPAQKGAIEQFAVFAALGLKYFSIRFIDVGQGVKNVMKLTPTELRRVVELKDEYGLTVSSLGSPIGKVKLVDQEDGTSNAYIPFEKYLAEDVERACELATSLGTRLIRGFSFYHPKGTNPRPYVRQAVDQLGAIADKCAAAGLTFGLEIEANLIGQSGELLAEMYAQLNHPALVLIFDAGNILCQGYTAAQVLEQFRAMLPGLGWIHIKDYLPPPGTVTGPVGHVDESALHHFVPADMGGCNHRAILTEFQQAWPAVQARMVARGAPGVFLDLEPHVKGGGQFGGYSGADGMGVALRGLCRVLDDVGIDYQLRDFADLRAARGF